MLQRMPAEVQTDLEQKGGVEANVTALSFSDEAEFLFDMIDELNKEELAARGKHGLKKSVQEFTGQDTYQFGDITKELVRRASKRPGARMPPSRVGAARRYPGQAK